MKSVTAIQPGKRTPAVVKAFSVKIVMKQFNEPMMKTRGDSVVGASHDLRNVGSAAIWSAQTNETRAMVGSLTKAQKANPASEIAPQTTSKVSIFQTLPGFRNDAATTTQGTSPSISVISDAEPTCCWISMTKASTPSRPQSDHVTRWGYATPRNVSRM